MGGLYFTGGGNCSHLDFERGERVDGGETKDQFSGKHTEECPLTPDSRRGLLYTRVEFWIILLLFDYVLAHFRKWPV